MLRQRHLHATLALGNAGLRPQPSSGWLRNCASRPVNVLSLWINRASQRTALAELEDHQLTDIGRSRAEARRECAKPFWQS